MRVLQLVNSAGYYGAENMIVTLGRFLNQLGCRSLLGVFRNLRSPHIEIADHAACENLPFELFPCHGPADWRAVRRIQRLIERNSIDLVHTHGYKADIYGYAAARLARRPVIATCHNWCGRGPRHAIYCCLDCCALLNFDKVVVVAQGIAERLQRFGMDSRRLVVIHNGVDTARFQCADPLLDRPWKQGASVVGYIGRLSEEKGCEYFLRAAREVLTRCPDTVFALFGDGPLQNRLELLARTLGVNRQVFFCGARSDMARVYASLDLVVLPSLDEGMPLAVLEAMASGIPVVATRVGSIPAIIESRKTGLLVQPGQASELRDAIVMLLGQPQLRYALAEAGRHVVAESFTADAMARNYLAIYESIVDITSPRTTGPSTIAHA
jgi:glycosyltransferase involved in cell wall biosynthesis